MKLQLSIYHALCECSTFKINGIEADRHDFGEHFDRSPNTAEDYGCGNMQFTRFEPKKKVLAKYKITKKEYSEICDKLEEGLSFGECSWCV